MLTMKLGRRKIRSSKKSRRPHGRCCPCLFMCGIAGMRLESCHFYTDLGCFCCNVRSARPDGRDLRKHLKLMPEILDGQMPHFRFHAWKALAAERAASWDDAILHYEACRQTLTVVEEKLPRSLHLWLLMWASTPLVSLYHLTNRNFAKSIEISEELMRCLQLRMVVGLRCWTLVCSENLKSRYRCRGRLSRILMELVLAHDALDRDRSLAYYEWSQASAVIEDCDERKGNALGGIEHAEHNLCHWLSKLYRQYGDLGRALHWASSRTKLFPQCPNHDDHDDEHWKLQMYDAELLRDCGDAVGYKDKIFLLRGKLSSTSKGQDVRDLDPEAVVAVENSTDDIKRFWQFFGALPVKQGTKLDIPSTLLGNQPRVASNWMHDVAHKGLKLKSDFEGTKVTGKSLRSQMFYEAVDFYRVALEDMERRKRQLRDKDYVYNRLDFLDKLASLYLDHYHDDGRAMKDLHSLIHYERKLYFHAWMTGSRADPSSILGAHSSLGLAYSILAVRFFNANEFLHNQEFDSTGYDFEYWHTTYSETRINKDLVKYLGLLPKKRLEESEMMEWVDQKYRGTFITGFVKAWRRSMKHNKIAAVMGSNILHSLRDSSHQLDDTWAINSLSDQNIVYDALQARIEEEVKMKRMLATCCKGVPLEKKILKYMERNYTSSGSPPKSLSRPFEKTAEKAYTCCEGFAGDGRSVESMRPSQEALLWSERNRTCSLVQQLLPNRLHRDAFDKLHEFDLQDQVAWEIISEAKLACGERAVIVEYVYCHYDQTYIAYVFNQDGEVGMRGLPFEDEAYAENLVRKVLEKLSLKSDKKFAKQMRKLMDELKELYSILIEPIADCLKDLTIEDKLVIVPFEGLTELPFYLLLDNDDKYLYEKFVPCIAPSLRTIKYLNERLCTLQGYSLKDQQSCLFVGDATFSTAVRLNNSRKEVGLISSMFEEKDIETLLGKDASVEKVLEWGRRASASSDEHEYCQAFAHIATHGCVDEKIYPKGALKFAPPNASDWNDSEDLEENFEGDTDEDSDEDEDEDMDEYFDDASNQDSHHDSGYTLVSLLQEEEMAGMSSNEYEPASEQNYSNPESEAAASEQNYSNQESEAAASDREMNPVEEMTVDYSAEHGISDMVGNSDAVAAQPAAEIGGVIKRQFRSGSGLGSKDMLSSDGIIGCGFDWRAHMVVLSACDTGKGKVLSEGVLNLPRAFLIAGVPCVVASQWPVDDDMTPELMNEFYSCMKRGSDAATALCHSMRFMKSRHNEDVHKWGTFNVWGLPTVCLPKELQNLGPSLPPPSSSLPVDTMDDVES